MPEVTHRESEAVTRKRNFLAIRYLVILATGMLAYAQLNPEDPVRPIVVIIGAGLLSNVLLGTSPPLSFFDSWTQAPVLVADTAMISLALLLSGAHREMFFFFFYVLIMAAKLENIYVLAGGAALLGLVSLLWSAGGQTWSYPMLMRIPFLFASGLFFGYVVLPERTGRMSPMFHAPGAIVLTRRREA